MIDKINWYQVKGLYKAKGGEKHITIGNFTPDHLSTVQPLQSGAFRVDNFVDDVSVVPLNLEAPDLGHDTVICASSLPFQLQGPAGYDSYLWSTGATSAELTVTEPGTYWLRCNTQCGSITDSVVISATTLPQLSVGNDTTICKGTALTLSAAGGFSSYSWSTGSSNSNISVMEAGTYSVTAQHPCGIRQAQVTIQLDSLPNIPVSLGGDTTLCADGHNLPLTISAYPLLPNYLWSTGATTQSITIDRKGTYYFLSNFRCGALSDTIQITECPPYLLAPNVFTPNGDGLNDIWQPVGKNIRIEELTIFDRWGKSLFESAGTGWTGNSFPEGIYFYYISYHDQDGKRLADKGIISLIR